jgi:hypothetical protein
LVICNHPKYYDVVVRCEVFYRADASPFWSIALVPIHEVKEYLKETKFSKNADNSIRHYHVLISDGLDPEMYWSETTLKVALKPFLIECQKKSDEKAESP